MPVVLIRGATLYITFSLQQLFYVSSLFGELSFAMFDFQFPRYLTTVHLVGNLDLRFPSTLGEFLEYRNKLSHIHCLNSPVYLVCDALVEVLWLLCILYVIQAQPAELPW